MSTLRAEVEAALDGRRWDVALDLLRSAGDASRTPDLLALRARAAYAAGDLEASIEAWEQQHRVLRDQGDRSGAARAAAMVAMFLLIDTGLMSPVRGWLRRAEGFVDDDPDDPVHAVLAAVRTYERFLSGDLAAARRESQRAVQLGAQHGDVAAEVIGRTARGRITILEGAPEQGLAELDEVGAMLVSGDVDPLTTGMMLCELVCAAQGLARHDIAAQWTDAMDRWRPEVAFGGFHGRCRVHRAEILRVTGPGDAAEDEALAACDELRPWMRREFGWPLAELGNVRLRRGDLDGAQEAFLAAHEHGWSPHPGLALVRLAQGRIEVAQWLIADAVDHPFRAPSKERPPFGELVLAPLLEAQAQIAVAAADLDTARAASERLQAIADAFPSDWLRAAAALASARTALLAGDLDVAIEAGGHAVAAWVDIGAIYEAAVARVVLGDALLRAGGAEAAEMEWDAAAGAFTRYGALDAAARTRARTRATSTPEARAGGEPRVDASGARDAARTATFRRAGDLRIIDFDGAAVTLRDLKGFRYLERMLAGPGREFHVLDLVAVEQGTLPTGRPSLVGDADLGSGDDRLPVLDDQARSAYKRRLDEIDADIDDAVRCNDPARAELAERDRQYLVSELRRAVGLGGRLRSVGSDAERARTAVARALRYARERVGEQAPTLARHLENCVHTGTYCSYRPDPLAPIAWSC